MTPSPRCATWAATAAAELRRAGLALADLLLPRACAGCDEPSVALWCDACARRVRLVTGPCCARCGAPWRAGRGGCGRCRRFGRPFAFARARALWRYAGPVRDAVHGFKFAGRAELLRPLGGRLARDVRVGSVLRAAQVAWVAPVPARARSRARRGYDQAEGLASGLALALGVPLVHALRRRREPEAAQAAQRLAVRRRQVRAAFAPRRRLPAGRAGVLVDDVLSTGATADAATRALLLAGSGPVYVATLAS